ncbi:alpha/beta fold hydrolase [Sciscionella marina]|uniref:alpha/beta fold hydrolase n=1 Tax=Sciscionella marina TaxID=508770 RepID=UPI00036C6010|nr:alpha/beta hydrolase [Sciscionella marina]
MLNTVIIDGWPIEYVDSGDPTAPPLIMLHGWAQDHRLFRHLEPLLAEHYRVLRVNFRGHDGRLTDRGDFTAEDLASDILVLIERLGLEDVRLLSTSHGCWVNIDVHERLGESSLGRTVVLDWLMQPFPGFHKQIREGCEPETHVAARQSLFDEWTEGTDCLDVLDHVNREMTWFGGPMWMRACREIEKSYAHWGDPLRRMAELSGRLRVRHIYSQPLSAEYRTFQEEFAREHPWFDPVHIPGQTHFPTLENPAAVAEAVLSFYA